MAYISNPAATLTFTANSKIVNVAGTNPILEGVLAGDMALDPNGMPLALDARGATTLTLKRNAPTSGTVTFEIMLGPSRSLVAQATATTREVWAQITAWADRGLSIPVIAVQNAPPTTPADGDRYLVGTAGSGAWAGRNNQFATWSATAGGWLFTPPTAGWAATVNGSLVRLQFTGTAWGATSPIAGTTTVAGRLARFTDTAGGMGQSQMSEDGSGNVSVAAALVIGSNGSTAPGSIYSDANWGMLLTAKQASPAQADFGFLSAGGTLRASLGSFGLNVIGRVKTADAVAASPSDLSKHLDLYGGIYGLSITGARLNYVVSATDGHYMRVGSDDVLVTTAAGVGVGGLNSGLYGKLSVQGSGYQAAAVQSSGGTIAVLAANANDSVRMGSVSNHPLDFFVGNAGRGRIDTSGNWSAYGKFSAVGSSFNPYNGNVVNAAIQSSGPFGGGHMLNDGGLVGAFWMENPGGGQTDIVFGAGGSGGLTETLRLRSSGIAQFRNDVRIGVNWNFLNATTYAYEYGAASVVTKYTDFNTHIWRTAAGTQMASLHNHAFTLEKTAAGAVGPILLLANTGGSVGDGASIDFWSVGSRRGYFRPYVGASPFQADWHLGNDTYGDRFIFYQGGALRMLGYGAGTLVTDTAGNVTASSDITLKENVQSWAKGLTAVLALDPISFNWTAASGYDRLNRYYGFSAQDVEEVLPEAIGMDENGHLTLMERPIIGALVNAIKDLHTLLQEARARIQTLEES